MPFETRALTSPAAKAMPSIRALTMAVMRARPPAASDEQSQVAGGHADHLPSAEPRAAPGWMIGELLPNASVIEGPVNY